MKSMQWHLDNSDIIEDENGWYSVIGHLLPKADLFRKICRMYGLSLADLGITGPESLRHEISRIKYGSCTFYDRDDPDTWDDSIREALDDDYWPYDYDQYYLVDENGAIPLTHWSMG